LTLALALTLTPAHARQREPEGRSPAQRAAKDKRSDGRGGTLLTRVRVIQDYGWGRAGGVTKTATA
ncbi:MAG: hypothetical protein WBM26_14385, partial [Polyangiales bacterium]